jgi:hypothetical protein
MVNLLWVGPESSADQFTLDTQVAVDDDAIPELDTPTTPDPAAGGRPSP